MELIIYDIAGKVKKTVSPDSSSQWAQEIGVENTVTVNFTTWEFFVLSVGDYIRVDGQTFKIKKEYRPRQTDKQKYTYNVKFHGREHDAEDLLFCRLNQGEDDLESVFAYDGTPMDFLQKAVQNLNRNTDGVVWKVGDAIAGDRKAVNFNGLYCRDALNEIAQAFETEWWVDGEYLNLCRCERGERVTLGYMQGLKTGLTQQENTNAVKWFTRLIPVGSTRNIDPSDYGYARLQLPSRDKYIDLNTQLGLKEHREENAFSSIYPHRIGTVSAVRSEEKTDKEGGKYTVYYVKDSDLPFNPEEQMLPGLVIHMTFHSGYLAGKDFECNWLADTQEFEIINTYPDENTQLPGGNLIPAIGNNYILWNIRMPDSYTAAAEQEYKIAVNNFLDEYARDISIYTADTDYIYVDSNRVPLSPGQRVRLMSEEYFGRNGGYRDSRMTRVVRKLDNLSEATIACSDAVNTSWKTSVDSSISNLEYTIAKELKQGAIRILKSGDTEAPSEYNVFSALRSFGEFISKKKDDIAQGIVTFLKGIKIGKFVAGWTGSGGAITVDPKTGKTRLEVDEVLARDRFDTMEYRFNRVDVIDGEQWSTFAFGKIKSVDTENRTVHLDLVEGELMSAHVNDLCRGIFHNISSDNAAGSKPDDCGFYTHAGFSTAYFTPTELLEDGSGFKYALRPGTTQYPCAGMKFAAYGNLTDPARRMSKVTNTRHTLYLKDVATWQIDPDVHYGAAYGDLTGITINGVEFNGYSSFQTNGYFKGHIEFLPDQMEELKGDGGYAVSLTTYDAVVAVDSLGRIDSSVYDIINVVDGEELVITGNSEVVTTRYKIQTMIQAFKGAERLVWATTPGKGSYSASFIAGGCTCVLNEGVLTVTGITEDKAEVTIEVNCEGEVAFTKNFTLTRVYGGVNANGVSYVFKQSAKQPATPTGTDIIPPGWSDGPSAEGKWWMSKGDINGTTGKAGNWTTPIQVTGQDGNGMYYEYAVNSSETDAPARGWTASVPSVASGQYLWMRWGKIVPPATYPASWDGTARVTGEKGEQGQQGIQGIQGEKGEHGLEGPPGSNGQTTYFHIKYSYSADGNPMTEDSSAPYIGTYVDYNPTDSSYYFYYTWRRFQGLQGDKGEQGISGMNGDDGLTYYTHIKYSDDGGRTFTSNNGETSGSYIGFCVDLNVNDPSYVGAYKWSKIKGDDGQDGQDANLLDWVEEWNGTKTTVNGTSVLSPKAYFGTVSGGKLSTGVLLGNNVYESGKAGIYGFSGGNLVFKLNSAGENTIGAFNITTQGLENNATPTAYVVIGKDGGKFFRVNRDSDCMCAIRGDSITALRVSGYGNYSTAVSVTAQAGTGTYAIKSAGNVELIARNTEVIKVNGLCVKVRTLTGSGSVETSDDFIRISTASDITVSLPTGTACTGKIIYMKQISTGNYTVTGGIRRSDQRSTESSYKFTDNKMRGFIFDGSYWNELYMST